MGLMKREIHSQVEMELVAKDFLQAIGGFSSGVCIVGLRGDLGAGKTTFSQSVAKQLGVTESVISPTFVLAKTYKTKNLKWKKIIHIDAYRFETPQEAAVLKLNESLTDGTLVLLEWPSQVEGVIIPNIYVDIAHNGGDSRIITYEAHT